MVRTNTVLEHAASPADCKGPGPAALDRARSRTGPGTTDHNFLGCRSRTLAPTRAGEVRAAGAMPESESNMGTRHKNWTVA